MKKILLFLSLIAYCFLFYKQSIGINVLLFSMVIVGGIAVLDRQVLKSKNWLLVAGSTLVTGVSAMLYGNFLSLLGNVTALILLANLTLNPQSTLIFTFFQGSLSFLTLPYFGLERIFDPKKNKPEVEKQVESEPYNFASFLKYFIPLLILVVFFFIYRASNPVFDTFIDNLNFDFISWSFVWFACIGFVLLYGFYYQEPFPSIFQKDKQALNTLGLALNPNEQGMFGELKKEMSAARMTFGMLNLLLMLVVVLDLNFIWSGKLNAPMDYSKYVHQGINSSIFSILIAILVILYFFRGNLNRVSDNGMVKKLALVWIFLNTVLLALCVHKNYTYIAECGLTHKRIGVYIYIALTFVGLITTALKIIQLKSNWYLIRINFWTLFFTLVISTTINWNKLIIDYNTKYKSTVEREYYLFQLTDASLPLLKEKWEKMPLSNDYYSTYFSVIEADKIFQRYLDLKIKQFCKDWEKSSWRSWNKEDERLYRELQKIQRK